MVRSRMALLFIALTIIFTVAGQLFVKQGTREVGASPAQATMLVGFIWRAFTNIWVVLGLGCAVIAAVSWTVAVSRSNLSFAYPFMALAIVLVLFLSGLIFGEEIPLTRWFGVLIVCLGIFVASRT